MPYKDLEKAREARRRYKKRKAEERGPRVYVRLPEAERIARAYASRLKHNLRKRYGMTVEDYLARLADQNYCCALCGEPLELDRPRATHVDHIEIDGRKVVRGILHGNCNTSLGDFDDDPVQLHRAVEYIEHHRFGPLVKRCNQPIVDEHY